MKTKNQKVINDAFVKFNLHKHRRMIEGLRGLLDDAVLFIFELHQIDGHTAHLETGDTYGWAIGWNGILIDKKITTGDSPSDNFSVSEQLDALIPQTKGYVGIVMAGMDPSHWFWFEHEEKYQEEAKDMIMAEIFRFFQP